MIKVGEYVRYFVKDDGVIIYYKIGKISQIGDRYFKSGDDYPEISNIIGNSKPTPVELLEVGDIVHYVDILDRKDEDVTIIKNEEMLKKFKNWFALNPKEITAIELNENRIIQRLEENNGN